MTSPLVRVRQFLSTPSARRATREEVEAGSQSYDFYPRPPRGGRLLRTAHLSDSIKFLSTPSARRATARLRGRLIEEIISIHALREEGDVFKMMQLVKEGYFYPRPPRGGRRCWY